MHLDLIKDKVGSNGFRYEDRLHISFRAVFSTKLLNAFWTRPFLKWWWHSFICWERYPVRLRSEYDIPQSVECFNEKEFKCIYKKVMLSMPFQAH